MSYNALLFCPEQKTYRTVTQVLLELDFQIEPCHEPFAAVKKLTGEHFDAIVVDCANEQNATLLFKSSRRSSTNRGSLLIAVVEGQAGVATAFRMGANLVLTKPINVEQSKGTIRVARGLLRKSDSPKSTDSVSLAADGASAQSVVATAELAGAIALGASAQSLSKESAGVSTSVFELEKEPEPKLEATEAALLASMPDPASAMLRAREALHQVSGSKSQPDAVENAGQGKPGSARAADSGGSATGQGVGAVAAAPATTSLEAKKPPADTPAASSSTESQSKRSGGKKLLVAVLILLVALAAAYFVWQKRHLQSKSGALEQPVIQPAPTPSASPDPAAATSPAPSSDSNSKPPTGQEKTPVSARTGAKSKKTALPVVPRDLPERPSIT
jgi:DNA-binding response OmpR family regulator